MLKGQNIGRAMTAVSRFWEGAELDDEFGRAMGAPMGELRPLIDAGRARGFRHVKRYVKAITGLRWNAFTREVERRTSARWVHFNTSLGREHDLGASRW